MSKMVIINEHFCCTPRTQYEMVGEKRCKCLKGTLYVLSSSGVGIAAGPKAQVVATIDGAVAEQQHPEGIVMSTVEKGVVISLSPKSSAEPVTTGTSFATGASSHRSIDGILAAKKGR
jgi:hypothetical protein